MQIVITAIVFLIIAIVFLTNLVGIIVIINQVIYYLFGSITMKIVIRIAIID